MDKQAPPVVVHPLTEGMRLVKIHGESVGKARRLDDLRRFLSEAGYEDVDVDNHELIEWRGGGSGVWPA
jgi:hypothetical protein